MSVAEHVSDEIVEAAPEGDEEARAAEAEELQASFSAGFGGANAVGRSEEGTDVSSHDSTGRDEGEEAEAEGLLTPDPQAEAATITRGEADRILHAASEVEALSKLGIQGRLDSLLGHMGNMFQRMDKLSDAVGRGEKAFVSKDDLQRGLKEPYPEIVDPVVEAFDERQILRAAEVAQETSETERVTSAVEAATFQSAKDHLLQRYPLWESEVWSPDFRVWLDRQPDKGAIEATAQPFELIAALDRFSIDALPAEDQEGETAPPGRNEEVNGGARARKNEQRRVQLQRAVVPKGDRSAARVLKSDEEVFREGFGRRKRAALR